MSIQTAVTAIADVACPACSRCGRSTRVYGIERSSEYETMDVRTFVCDGCETVEVRIVPTSTIN